MSMSVGDIFLNLSLNKKGFKKDIDGLGNYAQKSIGNSFKGLGKILGVTFGAAAFGAFAKQCIEIGSNVTEVQNVVDVTFGAMSDRINQFAVDAATGFGLSELAAKQYTGTMGAMLKSMGLSTDAAADMSIEIAKLAGDVASFYNLETDEAFAKIRSGISGETEPLKQLGINMSVANMEAYALSQGITKSYNAMNQADQALLRYNYLLSVTKDAQGDFARTSNSWANQIKILKLQWQSFMSTLGQVFIQFLTPVLQGLNRLLAWINAVTKSFANMIASLTGKKAQASTTTVSDGLSSASGAASDATGKTNGLTNSLNKAAKAARSLLGFDELNLLSTPAEKEDDSGLGSGLGAGAGAGTETVTEPVGEEQSKDLGFLGSVLEKLSQISLDNLTASFDRFKASLSKFGSKIWQGLKWGIDNILIPLTKWTIELALPAFLDLLSAGLDVVTASIEALSPLGQWLWDTFLQPMANFAGDAIIWVLQTVTDLLNNFSSWIGENQGLIETLVILFGSFFAATQLVYGGLNLIHTIAMAWNLVCELATIATTAFSAAMTFLTTPVGLVVLGITALIAAVILLVRHWDEVKTAAVNCWNWIQKTWKGACDWVKKTVIDPLWDNFKAFYNWLIGGFEGFVNGAIRGVNGIIDALNSISFTIPSWVPVIGGNTWSLNLPRMSEIALPRLAKGGLIDQPTLAMVGESGKEAVMPLENNTGWIDQLADRVAARLPQGNSMTSAQLDLIIELLRQLLDKSGDVYLMDEIVGIIGEAWDRTKGRRGDFAFNGINR